jgi:hypothetical protein
VSSMFTNNQYNNIQRGSHPDCCDGDVCSACGASEANGQACAGEPHPFALELWRAALRHDHNADAERMLFPHRTNDSALLDRAARNIPFPPRERDAALRTPVGGEAVGQQPGPVGDLPNSSSETPNDSR